MAEVEEGKTPPPGGGGGPRSAGGGGLGSGEGYPFPELVDVRPGEAGGVGGGEGETPGVRELVEELRTVDVSEERPRSGAGGAVAGEMGVGEVGERPGMGARSLSRRNSGGGA